MVMSIKSLDDALNRKMRQLMGAERQIARNLPRLAKKCEHEQLREAFNEHAKMTEHHIERLEQCFSELGKKSGASKSETLSGLIDDGNEVSEARGDGMVRDAAMIAAEQAIEHFEIAAYGTCATWAKELGHERVAQLLHETLEEEKQTDHKLTELAKRRINEEAIHRA